MKAHTRFVWVIRTTHKSDYLLFGDRIRYFANRTSLKNPHFLTGYWLQVKFFYTKEDAEQYLYQKRINGHFKACQKCFTTRIKIWIDKDGYLDYFKNSDAFKERDKHAPSQKNT